MISILVQAPLLSGIAWSQRIERPSQYNHVINAQGGFESSTCALAMSDSQIDDWLANGILRHVEAYNPALETVWEGFVNQVDVVYGNLTVTVGPLLRTVNRLDASYTTVDVTVIPPTEGVQANVGWIDDAASQTRYGVLPAVISVGETTPADAATIQQTYLANHRTPATTQVFSSITAVPQVAVHCLGYRYWLLYVYNQLVNVGTINTDAKLVDILTGTDAATGNPYNLNSAWLPFDTTYVEAPAAPAAVPRYEYENRTAWELIQGITARGDANQNRWLFGLYAGREAWYQMAPTTVEYEMDLSDPSLIVRGPAKVDPWDVRPGRWLTFTDFLAGASFANLDDDPRTMFIETVTYTAPNQLVLNGEPESTLSDVMASFGLGGVGV